MWNATSLADSYGNDMPSWWYEQIEEEHHLFVRECEEMSLYWSEEAAKPVTIEEVYWESPTDFKVRVGFDGLSCYFHSLLDAERWLEGWTA